MKRMLQAEGLKMRHTWMMFIVFIIPVLLGAFSYYLQRFYLVSNNLNFWYMMMYPFLAAVLGGLAVQIDRKMKNQGVLGLPVNLKQVWRAKVLVVTGMAAAANFVLCIETVGEAWAFGFGLNYADNPISYTRILIAGLLILICFAWQVPFCMYLEERWGMIITVVVNSILSSICGCLASITSIWWLFPHGYGARLMIPVLRILPNGIMVTENTNQSLLSMNVVFPAILVSVILYFFFMWLGIRQYIQKEAV